MKIFMSLCALAIASPSFAADVGAVTYLCKPYKNNDAPPSDWGLPGTFEIYVGPKASLKNLDIKITANNKVYGLKSDPFTNNVPSAKVFDRFFAKGLCEMQLEKTIYKKPSYFTAKMMIDVDPYHGQTGWYGFACNVKKEI